MKKLAARLLARPSPGVAAQVPSYPSARRAGAPVDPVDPGTAAAPPPAAAARTRQPQQQPNVDRRRARRQGQRSATQQPAAAERTTTSDGGDTAAARTPSDRARRARRPSSTSCARATRCGTSARYYFNDPWQWPKVWSYNPQITNPHWIYPGDLVRLLPRGMFAEQQTEPRARARQAAEPRQPDNLPPPARAPSVGIKQTAFVEKSDLDKSITIDGAVDEKELLGIGDSVYLSYPANKPPKVGQRYSIYKPDNTVKQAARTSARTCGSSARSRS